MADFKGIPCPVCGQIFQDGEDIVVCPECGTPYHRACWEKTGHCLHEAEHAAGFVWQPPRAAASEQELVCPNCGTHNPPGTERCQHCGVPLPDETAEKETTPIYARGQAPGPHAAPRSGPPPRAAAPDRGEPLLEAYGAGPDGSIYKREIGPDDAIDGIKVRDWASYVGRSSPYYLMQFFRMSETRRKFGVSVSALLFGPVYFFYRKMWREGALFTALTLLLNLPSMLARLAQAGVQPVASWSMPWLETALNIGYFGGWALNFVMCFFAVYWYKQTASRRIRAIYAQVPDGPDRTDALILTGGTSLPAAFLCFALLMAVSYCVAMLMFPYFEGLLLGAASSVPV